MPVLHPTRSGRPWLVGIFHFSKAERTQQVHTDMAGKLQGGVVPTLPLHSGWHGQNVLRGVKHGYTDSCSGEISAFQRFYGFPV